jgi:Sigma-70, region 4.
MTAKQYLNKIRDLHKDIYWKEYLIQQEKEMSTTLTGVDYARDRVQTSKGGDSKFSECVDRKEDIVVKQAEDIREFRRMKAEAVAIIEQLEKTDEKMVLSNRYLCRHSWEDAAAELGTSLRRVYQIHSNALRNFEKNMNQHCT